MGFRREKCRRESSSQTDASKALRQTDSLICLPGSAIFKSDGRHASTVITPRFVVNDPLRKVPLQGTYVRIMLFSRGVAPGS